MHSAAILDEQLADLPTPCSRCPAPAVVGQRYCRECRAAYTREYRKRVGISEAEKKRNRVRAYTNVLVKRGKLARGACKTCGGHAGKTKALHLDYEDPRNVEWYCATHHTEARRELRRKELELPWTLAPSGSNSSSATARASA